MERKLINIIPEGVEEVFHASLGDDGRIIRCDLTETLTGAEALSLYYLKSNGNFDAITIESASGNYVDISLPSAVTDIPGFVYCKLHIDGIGAKAFLLNVEQGA